MLSSVYYIELLEEEGRPSTVASDIWFKMRRRKKWTVMHKASEELSKRFKFFEGIRDIADDSFVFSSAMTNLLEELRQRIESFVETSLIVTLPFANNVENELYDRICQGIYWFSLV